MVPAWQRSNYVPGGAAAHVALIVLSHQRLPDPLPISRLKHGMPEGEGSEATAITVKGRDSDGAAFVADVLEPFLALLSSDLGEEAAARAATCEHAYVITSELPDPDDLGHLQAAWAIAKCVCEQPGAEAVIDIHAVRAHLAEDIAALPPTRTFELMHEISLLFDTVADGTVAAWTTGMRKFGRPDVLLLGLPSETSAEAAVRLRDLAAILAAGERIEVGDLISTDDGDFEARAVPDEHAGLIDGDAVWLAEHPSDRGASVGEAP
jgi:hypothetical protein